MGNEKQVALHDDMTDSEFLAAVESTCSPAEKEIDRLRAIESAAMNLVAQKGRHNTEIAYRRLVETLTHNV